MPATVIGIITYRRPDQLSRLLAALQPQLAQTADPARDAGVLVVDNDSEGSARAVCEQAKEQGLSLTYVQEPLTGIPQARNRLIDSLPDDCTHLIWANDTLVPQEGWLATMLMTAAETEADVVMGSLQAVLPEGAPKWVERGGFFNRRRFIDFASLSEGSSANCLMRVERLRESGLRYDETLSTYGGSDAFFFRKAATKGWRMVWAQDALAFEHIPLARCRLSWLWRRNLRAGNTLALCDIRLEGLRGWLRRLGRALQKLVQGIFALPLVIAGFQELARAFLLFARGCGMLLGLVGIKVREPAS